MIYGAGLSDPLIFSGAKMQPAVGDLVRGIPYDESWNAVPGLSMVEKRVAPRSSEIFGHPAHPTGGRKDAEIRPLSK